MIELLYKPYCEWRPIDSLIVVGSVLLIVCIIYFGALISKRIFK
jgi:hypothetical protein